MVMETFISPVFFCFCHLAIDSMSYISRNSDYFSCMVYLSGFWDSSSVLHSIGLSVKIRIMKWVVHISKYSVVFLMIRTVFSQILLLLINLCSDFIAIPLSINEMEHSNFFINGNVIHHQGFYSWYPENEWHMHSCVLTVQWKEPIFLKKVLSFSYDSHKCSWFFSSSIPSLKFTLIENWR